MKNTKTNITLTNDFHNTSVVVRADLLVGPAGATLTLTDYQTMRVRTELCGLYDCTCGGIRGEQSYNNKPLTINTVEDLSYISGVAPVSVVGDVLDVHDNLTDAIEAALREAAGDSNPVMRYHIIPKDQHFRIIASGNEDEPGSLYAAPAAGEDALSDTSDLELYDDAEEIVEGIENKQLSVRAENLADFLAAFGSEIEEEDGAEIYAQWAGFSNALADSAREEIEQRGAASGREEGREFNKLYNEPRFPFCTSARADSILGPCRPGFTMVELLAVLSAISILAAIIMPRL
jgi:prepilin-type N-terminal cleavage/methylation domain-containing protein